MHNNGVLTAEKGVLQKALLSVTAREHARLFYRIFGVRGQGCVTNGRSPAGK